MPFEWRVHEGGYRWTGAANARRLIETPGEWRYRKYAPLDEQTGLVMKFATTAPTEDAILAFANQFGMLGIATQPEEQSEPYSEWERHISAMHGAMQRWEELRGGTYPPDAADDFFRVVNHWLKASYLDLEELTVLNPLCYPPHPQILRVSANGKPGLESVPANLLNALWLQLALAIVRETEFRQMS